MFIYETVLPTGNDQRPRSFRNGFSFNHLMVEGSLKKKGREIKVDRRKLLSTFSMP